MPQEKAVVTEEICCDPCPSGEGDAFIQGVACAFIVLRLLHVGGSLAMLLIEWSENLNRAGTDSEYDAEYEPAFLWLVPTVMSLLSISAVVSVGFKGEIFISPISLQVIKMQ